METYSLHPRGWEKKRHARPPAAGKSREIWSEEAMVVRKGWGNEHSVPSDIRKCSMPSSAAVGNPWRYGPIHHLYQHSRGKWPGVTYRYVAVVTLSALHQRGA